MVVKSSFYVQYCQKSTHLKIISIKVKFLNNLIKIKPVLLQKKSMDSFAKKYIYKDWIPIKKIYDKIRLYIAKELN
jgi:hypothetical protein